MLGFLCFVFMVVHADASDTNVAVMATGTITPASVTDPSRAIIEQMKESEEAQVTFAAAEDITDEADVEVRDC
jgi:hypothetical protein